MEELTDIEQLSEAEKNSLILQLRSELQSTQFLARKQEALLKIYKQWVRIKGKLYPDCCRGENIRGIELDLLDIDISGCVNTFLTRGKLCQQQKECLYACDDDLSCVTLELQGYEGFYFRQLKTIVSAIIEYQKNFPEEGEQP